MTNTDKQKIYNKLSFVLGSDPKLKYHWTELFNYIESFSETIDIETTLPSKIDVDQITKDAKSARYQKCVSNMKTLRKLNDLTLNELAVKLDMNLSQINYIEKGKRFPSEKIVDAYCKYFKISKSKILDFSITLEIKATP